MPAGGCLCNKLRIEFSGEPNAHLLCHCHDCRKISGGMYSNNVVVGEENVKVEGTSPRSLSVTPLPSHVCRAPRPWLFRPAKEFSTKADSGKNITSHFCPDCGTTVYRTGESFPNAVIVKAGVLDGDWVEKNRPKGELFAAKRLNWVPALEGAAQMDGMPS